MKKILATMISIVMILSLAFAVSAETPAWTGTSGSAWAANGDDMIHAGGTQTDWLKVASTNTSYQDFTISGKIAVAPNGTNGGDDTFLILRDQGTTATGDGGAIIYSAGIRFVFRWGHFGMRNGAANLPTALFAAEGESTIEGVDTGVNGYFITNIYAPSDVIQYIPFSITLDGAKVTAMTLNSVDVTDWVKDVTLPVTASGKVTIGSFINPPSYEMGIKDVVITPKGQAVPTTPVSESPSTGDTNTVPVVGIIALLAIAAAVLTAKKVRA